MKRRCDVLAGDLGRNSFNPLKIHFDLDDSLG
jgi:hypothetical protein